MAGAGTIVEREVLRGQRRWQTFAFRGGFATALFGLFVLQYRDLTAWQDWSRPSDMAYVGERLFEMTMFGQWWLLGLLTPILVAQGIVEEKNQGTLDLLAISQITPAQLLRGKVYSSLSHVGLLVLAGLPVVALSLSFGGVAPASILVAYGCTFAGVLTLASLSAFFAMFARGPLGPLLLTWGTAFFGWIVMALPAIIAADDEDAFGWMSLAYAFFEGIDEPRLWIAWPVLLWIGLSFAIMHLAGQVFVSLLASRGGEDPDSALLSVEVWGIERLRRRQALRLTVLVFTGPIPLLSGYYGGRFALLLIPSFVWVQLALFTSLVAVLLAARSLLLKTASVRGRRKLSAAEKEALVEDGPRRRGVRPPGAREVWGNPVAWRETVTRAHGFITTVAGRVYIAAMVLLAVVLLFLERLDIDGEAWWAAAMMGYAFTGVLAVLVATSSMVAEQRRGTLALLCVTPLGGGRIVLGKLLGLGVYLTPPFVMASVCALLGSSHSLSRFRWWNQVPDTSLLVTRTGFAMWLGFAAALFLGSASLWLAARMRTPTRAWMATVGFACAVAIVPGIALGLARGQGWVSEVVAWINPVLSESFWEDDLPHRVIPSGVAWVSLSLALLAHNARTLGRVAR